MVCFHILLHVELCFPLQYAQLFHQVTYEARPYALQDYTS